MRHKTSARTSSYLPFQATFQNASVFYPYVGGEFNTLFAKQAAALTSPEQNLSAGVKSPLTKTTGKTMPFQAHVAHLSAESDNSSQPQTAQAFTQSGCPTAVARFFASRRLTSASISSLYWHSNI